MNVCKHCGVNYSPSRKSSKFCSRDCANKFSGYKRLKKSSVAAVCDCCGDLKPANKFSLVFKFNYSGPRKSTCKKCSSAIAERKRRDSLWNKDIVSYLLSQARQRCSRNGTNFSIKKEDVYMPNICPVFKVDMPTEFRSGKTRNQMRNNFGPSLDRIDNTKGYTPDNIVVMSYRANMLKSDATLKELVMLGEWAKSELEKS